MPSPIHARFKKNLLASLIGVALTPHSTWAALDFAQSPPGTVEPYVAPNVILSLDDSTSMNANMFTSGGVNLGWRTVVLKNAVLDVFNDTTLLPDGKIRLAWQTMGNCTHVGANNAANKWAVPLDATSATNKNVMRVFGGTHRTNFITYMQNYKACTNTPTHDMVQRADQYMRAALHQNGPWADIPGTKLADAKNNNKPLGCRRNYHILLTDGGWNGAERQTIPRNFDGNDRTLPDGTPYAATPQTRLYRDSENYTTIADWAMKSWADKLQDASNLEGMVSPTSDYDAAPATETIKNRITNTTATLGKYWNPKYNPADWAHMVTFTIGFSNDALPKQNYDVNGNAKGAITAPTSMLPYGDDGNLADYANGTYVWRAQGKDRGHDMWHAALNGRGQFYAVESGDDLKKAFKQIVKTINTQTKPDLGSTATSGSNASRTDVGRYIASYVPKDAWKGAVAAETFKTDGTTVPAWSGKTTADLLDAPSFNVANRLILSWSDKVIDPTTGQEKGGVSFEWASDESRLSNTQKLLLDMKDDGTNDGLGEDRLNFIRGNRTKEGTENPANFTATTPFRERKSRQGSIINSEVWYVGAPISNYAFKDYLTFTRSHKNRLPMIYVGGNDGMLHGFSAADGSEKIAYVPRGTFPALGRLTDPTYNKHHQYYVDGSPMTGDVDLGSGDPNDPTNWTANWQTVLVGTLGAGGKGYFVLNVTNPGTNGGGAGDFTKTNASTLVVLDTTRHASESVASVADCQDPSKTPTTKKDACLAAADMGHIFAKPVVDETNVQRSTQIVRLNNNRWAVVMGNGYNSKSERPVLMIQYLDGDKKLVRLVATGSTGTGAQANTTENGLSAPRLVDINSDGRPDVVYAGDLKGNLWKFLITDSDDTKWGVAQWGSNADQTTNDQTNGTPLYSAKGGTEGSPNVRSLIQPITAAPSVRANDRTKEISLGGGNKKTVPVGGMMIAFGTGRNVTKNDPQDNNKQTLYSVLDNTSYKKDGPKKDRLKVCASTTDGDCSKLVKSPSDYPKPAAFSSLVQRITPDTAAHTRSGQSLWVIDATTKMDWASNNGWYMDLPKTRERLLKPMNFYDGSNVLTVFSQVPAKGSHLDPNVESCDAGSVDDERQYMTLINIMDGKPPSVQIMDTNLDGQYNLASDIGASVITVPGGPVTMIKKGNKMVVSGANKNGSTFQEELALMPEVSMRPSWRQLK